MAEVVDCIFFNRHFRDLNPILCGEEVCSPGHRYGPAVRSYVLIHFVVSGCGSFIYKGNTYSVHKGEAFIVPAGEVMTYYADTLDPWHYMWMGFDGKISENFASLPPVITYSVNWAEELLDLDRNSPMLEYNAAAKLFMMYSEWFAEKTEKSDYVSRVKDYVDATFTQQISVEMIAEHMSLDRRYISRLFKQKTGKTIQEYIIKVRIKRAKRLLEEGYNISQSAHMCGYEDVCNFSKMFKKQTGISPGAWKKSKSAEQSKEIGRSE